MKQTYEIRVTVQQAGIGNWSETTEHTVQATTRGRAEAQAKKAALAGRKAPYYATAWAHREA